MARYRNKPVIFDAVKVLLAKRLDEGFGGPAFSEEPEWLRRALDKRTIRESTRVTLDFMTWDIGTPDGWVFAMPGVYVICNTDGTLGMCQPDIFKTRYEIDAAREGCIRQERKAGDSYHDECVKCKETCCAGCTINS